MAKKLVKGQAPEPGDEYPSGQRAKREVAQQPAAPILTQSDVNNEWRSNPYTAASMRPDAEKGVPASPNRPQDRNFNKVQRNVPRAVFPRVKEPTEAAATPAAGVTQSNAATTPTVPAQQTAAATPATGIPLATAATAPAQNVAYAPWVPNTNAATQTAPAQNAPETNAATTAPVQNAVSTPAAPAQNAASESTIPENATAGAVGSDEQIPRAMARRGANGGGVDAAAVQTSADNPYGITTKQGTPANATATTVANGNDGRMPSTSIPIAEWAALPYDEAAKKDPSITPAKYLGEAAKYRRANNLPDMTNSEVAAIIRNRDPYRTEEESKKDRKNARLRTALVGAGDLLGHIINYARTKAGNPAMNLERNGSRIAEINKGRERVMAQNAADVRQMYAADVAAYERQKQRAEEADRLRLQMEQNRILNEQRLKNMILQGESYKTNNDYNKAKLDEYEKFYKYREDEAAKKGQVAQSRIDANNALADKRRSSQGSSSSRQSKGRSTASTSYGGRSGNAAANKAKARDAVQRVNNINNQVLAQIDKIKEDRYRNTLSKYAPQAGGMSSKSNR